MGAILLAAQDHVHRHTARGERKAHLLAEPRRHTVFQKGHIHRVCDEHPVFIFAEAEDICLFVQLDLERFFRAALPGGVAPAADLHRQIFDALALQVRKVRVVEALRYVNADCAVAVILMLRAGDHILDGALRFIDIDVEDWDAVVDEAFLCLRRFGRGQEGGVGIRLECRCVVLSCGIVLGCCNIRCESCVRHSEHQRQDQAHYQKNRVQLACRFLIHNRFLATCWWPNLMVPHCRSLIFAISFDLISDTLPVGQRFLPFSLT